MRVVDHGDTREVSFTGSVIAEHPLVPCSECGRFFATPAQRDFVGARMELPPPPHLEVLICPECSRRLQAGKILGYPDMEIP
jgi:hypothetical protein